MVFFLRRVYRFISFTVFMGGIFSLIMAIITSYSKTEPQFFWAENTSLLIEQLSSNVSVSRTVLMFSIFDNLFVVGYMVLFYGLYLLVKNFSEDVSKLALFLGWLTGFFDIIENVLNIFLAIGVPNGYQPIPLHLFSMWFATYSKDVLSVVAVFLFLMLLLDLLLDKESEFRGYIAIFAVLL